MRVSQGGPIERSDLVNSSSDNIDVFVSYKREERELMTAVTEFLANEGYVAVSDEQIEINDSFPDAIDRMLQDAKLTIVLWTKKSVESPWVKKEARRARFLFEQDPERHAYVPVLLENVMLPLDMGDENCVDLVNMGLSDGGLAHLLGHIKSKIGTPSDLAKKVAREVSGKVREEYQIYSLAHQLGSIDSYQGYLTTYPKGRFVSEAKGHIKQLNRSFGRVVRKIASLGAIGVFVAALAALPSYWSLFTAPSTNPNTSQTTTLVSELAQARQDLSSEKDSLDELRTRYVEQSDQITKLLAERTQAQSTLAKTRDALRAAEVTLDQNGDTLATLQGDLSASTREIEQLKFDRQAAEQKLVTVQSQLDSLQSENDLLRSTIRTRDDQNRDLIDQNNLLSKANEDLDASLEQVTIAREIEASEVSALNVQISNLKASQAAGFAISDLQKTMYEAALATGWNPSFNQVESRVEKFIGQTLNSLPVSIRSFDVSKNYDGKPTSCSNIAQVQENYHATNEMLGIRIWASQEVFNSGMNFTDAVYDSENYLSIRNMIVKLEADELKQIVKWLWDGSNAATHSHYSRHVSIMKMSKKIVDDLIKEKEFKAISSLVSYEYDEFRIYSFCETGKLDYVSMQIMGEPFTMWPGTRDVAEFPLAFWARRYVDGSYAQATVIMDELGNRYDKFCKANTCSAATPFIRRTP